MLLGAGMRRRRGVVFLDELSTGPSPSRRGPCPLVLPIAPQGGGRRVQRSGARERAHGRSDFTARDRLIVREAHAALSPLIGGPLARFAEPSPLDLAPRARQVLGCSLEGDGDEQIAARLKLSRFTVNQYTRLIFRHFGVSSRPELLARWVRRMWGSEWSRLA